MKTAKRTLALFIAVLMVATSLLSVSVFAAVQFTDVADNYTYRSAIYSLVGKGVINGIEQEDGTFLFKPEATITRAEFAKMIAVAVTGNAALSETTNKFPDVAEDHWANKYIAYAVKAGIINGRDDGTFRPENPVTYGEAVKMIVCAKGYGSLYKQNEGEPWYQGYIKIANDVNLTKNAIALGTAEAPRGMVAQLIYNMDYAKNVSVGGTGGGPTIDYGDDDDDWERDKGVVTAVFETSLTGENYGLNKFQVMVNGEVYNLADGLNIDSFYSSLGVMIEYEYSDSGSTKVIERVKDYGYNDVLVIKSENIESISSDMIEYYKDENATKISEARLASNLYVIYNGQGVARKDITDDFIEEYFDIESGEIRLENNNGGKDFEIAYVTSYETYYVTGRTASKDIYTFNDAYASKSVALENNDDNYVVYKVTSEGGSKSASTVGGIGTSKVVLSVAKPLTNGVTEAIVSTVTLKNAEVTEMSGYDEVWINDERYYVSDYYKDLIDKDKSTYGFNVGDMATFYLDFAGKIVFMTKAESTEPYAYVLGFDSGSGLDGTKVIQLFAISGSSGTIVKYPVKSNVKVNGSTKDASELERILRDNAEEINGGRGNVTNGKYAQLVKFATANVDGIAHLSEIYTVDIDDPQNGYVVPAKFRSDDSGESKEFSEGGRLLYTASKAFTYDKINQFVINSSTVIILVPEDVTEHDKIKKASTSYFSSYNTTGYVVEPYDVKNNVAKAVLVYTGKGSNEAEITGGTDAMFICSISSGKNPDGEDPDEIVDKIRYIKAGDEATDANIKTIYSDDSGVAKGIKAGDVVKFGIDSGVVTKIRKVFVDGVLYNSAGTALDEGGEIQETYNNDSDYYRAIHGTVDSVAVDEGTLNIVPQIVDSDDDVYTGNWQSFPITSSTRFYIYDSDEGEYSTEADLGSLNGANNGDVVDPYTASQVLVIVKANSVKAVYILDTNK